MLRVNGRKDGGSTGKINDYNGHNGDGFEQIGTLHLTDTLLCVPLVNEKAGPIPPTLCQLVHVVSLDCCCFVVYVAFLTYPLPVYDGFYERVQSLQEHVTVFLV